MTKRLKLKVQRHRLPDVDIVWPLKETEGRNPLTVAALLADIDHAIPLESGEWTLDQYVAELDGFECLHYAFVSDVFKESDSVTIRPLGTPDVKARRLGGRTQITGEGFHIVDGVPFGMGPMQRPARPGVLIPSRKRRRPEMEEEDEEGDITIAELEYDEELLEHVNGGRGTGLAFQGIEEVEEGEEEGARPKKKQKNVHFKVVDDIPGFSIEEEDEDEEDDGDFDPEGGAGTSEEGSEGDEDSASSEDDDSDHDDDDSSASSSEVSSSSDSSSDSDSDSDVDSLPEVQSTKAPLPLTTAANGLPQLTSQPKANGIPYQGSIFTQERNKRRRNRSRLLKRVRSIIGEKASVADCDAWMKENPEQATYVRLAAEDGLSDSVDGMEGDGDEEEEFTGFSESADASLIAESAAAGVNGDTSMPDVPVAKVDQTATTNTTTTKTNSKSPSFTKQRQNLLAALSSGGVLNSEDPNPKSLTEAEVEVEPEDTAMAPDTKRVRLNADGARRAIFGALGQRTPKTQQDAEKVRARLAGLGKPKAKAKAAEEEVPEEDPLSDAWRSKIKLMAVDCDDPSVKLSEPPYPFKQRWDVTQQREAHWWEKGGKKRKRKARNSYGHDENWDEEEGEKSYLDYGEGEEGGEEEYAEGDEEVAEEDEGNYIAVPIKDDLPSLPADITILPALTQSDVQTGAIIAFKQLECTQFTNWAPTLSAHRTAEVLSYDAEIQAVEVQLAIRDREVRSVKYDQQGKRVYEKFEMDDGIEDEEGEDDGERVMTFNDMVEPKLIKVAEGVNGAYEDDTRVAAAVEGAAEPK